MKRKTKVFTAAAVALAMCMPMAACTEGNGTGGKHTVTYYDSDGVTVLLEQTVAADGKAYDWSPRKDGYQFDDWYTTSDFSAEYDFDSAVTQDIKIYAKFTTSPAPIVNYTVTYVDGTETLMKQTVNGSEKGYNWTPKKDGSTFVGWYKDSALSEEFNFNGIIKADTTLYAKFEKNVEQYPVTLAADGRSFTYGYEGSEKTVEINEKTIYVDGRLSDEQIEGFDNVYNSFKQAMDHLVDGTEAEPMEMYLAPYVYWIHNPDSTNTTEAYGIVKSCENLHITGLTDDARNVVIAANYGHNEGYDGGNWTMFNITGDGLTLKNLTFGDYCNVDLEYPLNPSLNRAKRTNNVTQGQIGSYSGDKLYAENVRFISRLNMMPFISSGRALYVDCHMESTDDSLNGSSQAVYLNCDFEFYSGKPWGGSSGVTLLGCQMKIVHMSVGSSVSQYLAKGAGPYAVIDCEFIDDYTVPVNIGWSDVLSDTYRSYYSNVTHNGTQITMDNGGTAPDASVDLTGTEALKAYKLVDGDKVIYNVYNLLRGDDDWDPLEQKEKVTALGATDVPLTATAYLSKSESYWGTSYVSSATIESGKDEVDVSVDVFGRQDTDYASGLSITWSIKEEDKSIVTITPSADGKTCRVAGINTTEEAKKVIVTAILSNGLEAVVALTVRPTVLEAPAFTADPVIVQNSDGTAKVDYALDLGTRADMSRIIWSVCDDAAGTNPIEIAVGRSTTPLKTITLSKAYVGKYLQVSVESKNIRSDYGTANVVTSSTPITADGIAESNVLHPDISIMSTKAQTELKEGFWTLDAYIPEDTKLGYKPLDSDEIDDKYSKKVNGKWTEISEQSWAYGTGNKNGFKDYSGLYHTGRGARLRYSAIGETFGDMDVTLKLAPGKTAAQGFGSDYQYMDIMIKFDNETLTGYGLRIYRSSGNSCEFVLMQYADGLSKEICTPVRSTAYLTECTVRVWTEGNTLKAHVESSSAEAASKAEASTTTEIPVTASVDLSATITANTYGDFCLINTGTTGDNTTYIGDINIEWKN